ncbi:uncharacterized protein LOC590650 [Strongylocentrotus purpuratus]|uniref:Major facilitator superfamily (MFS) profile domain-containing protein n=1 Tax=Strongylocentrotus purpuratus TaxID=7668 RepID=A0A7M7PKR7_STRPU|nr:uncharacterized protein LOC590650 [Strongylocentrotus purpuratus]XP_030852683.1 uncharacterized protein LOC590650 [Strongylocentrotus purpuratus]XP_795340.3 uncharacterized protein LOC590650 [Strongylocentrotus purpuratus]|eukprot:XP_011662759.1 PREDICTED: uncharacterized protein LOC590650 [Strongylocentrotus purpuratus]
MATSWLQQHWGWVVTGATCIAFFFSYGFILSFSILFVTFQREFRSSATATAWVGSLPFGLSAIVAPVVNLLIERIGYRAVVIIGILMISLGLILTSFMQSLAPMFFTYSILFGFGTGCILMGSLNLILKYFPHKNATGGVVLPMASSNLGMLSIGQFTFYFENKFGWRNTLRVSAGMIIGIALPAVAWAHREPTRSATPGENNDIDDDSDMKLKVGDIGDNRTVQVSIGGIKDDSAVMEKVKSETEECDESKYADYAVSTPNSRTYTDKFESEKVEDDADNGEQRGKILPCNDNYQRLTETMTSQFNRNIRHSIDKGKISTTTTSNLKAHFIDESIDEHATSSMARRMLIALTFPDVWCLALAVFGYGLTNSFFIIQMVSYMMSLGFTEENGAQAVVALGVSMIVGKVTLALISDYIPFHQLYLSTLASGLGITVMICLLQAPSLFVIMCMIAVLGSTVFSISDALPYFSPNLVFGVAKGRETSAVLVFMHGLGMIIASVLGESLDQTGSYNVALYMCIGTYAICGLLCIMVPVYQQCMVTDRYVMKSWKGFNRKKRRETTSNPEILEDL